MAKRVALVARRDPYETYLRGYTARTFDTATDIDLHGEYAFALGACHAAEKIPPHCRRYILPLVAAATSETLTKRKKAA